MIRVFTAGAATRSDFCTTCRSEGELQQRGIRAVSQTAAALLLHYCYTTATLHHVSEQCTTQYLHSVLVITTLHDATVPQYSSLYTLQ